MVFTDPVPLPNIFIERSEVEQHEEPTQAVFILVLIILSLTEILPVTILTSPPFLLAELRPVFEVPWMEFEMLAIFVIFAVNVCVVVICRSLVLSAPLPEIVASIPPVSQHGPSASEWLRSVVMVV